MPDQPNGNGTKIAAAAKSPYVPAAVTFFSALVVAIIGWQTSQVLSDVRSLILLTNTNSALIEEVRRVNDRQDRKLQSHDSRLQWVEIRLGDARGPQ